MRIGILADSHGRAATTARAIALLERAGAELLIHLGDFETERVLDELVGRRARVVFGNCDWDVGGLTSYARNLDIAVDHPMGRVNADGHVIAFTHGHLPGLMQEALEEGVDYLLHGHTHALRDDRAGDTRIINPGALFRASRYTAVILDTATDELTVLEVPKENDFGSTDA